MTLTENLVAGRSNLAFILGLSIAGILAFGVETRVDISKFRSSGTAIPISENQTMMAVTGTISRQDLAHAHRAWGYFDSNFNPETGLVNSVNNFHSTTVWDQASYLLGLISAQRLDIVSDELFDDRMGQVLNTLSNLPLYDGALPNKAYNTQTLEMTDYGNTPDPRGIGWSALDVARMSVPLNILLYDYPNHAGAAGQILSSWDFAAMIEEGALIGSRVDEDGQTERVQEGRLGYEEYAARAIGLLGLDALSAAKYDDFLKFEKVEGQLIGVDNRTFAQFDANNFVVSEPYILTAIEFGFDRESRELADRVYRAQEQRYNSTGVLTAVSEDNINQEPYFIYNTVYANGQAWNALAESGEEYPELRTVSTKAAFGWDAIFGTEYTEKLVDHILATATDSTGFNSGIYETTGEINEVATANTNGIILETIQYRANGPLLTARFNKKGPKS
jgi:hypothetical protein